MKNESENKINEEKGINCQTLEEDKDNTRPRGRTMYSNGQIQANNNNNLRKTFKHTNNHKRNTVYGKNENK